jgi:hypothetical protein
MHVELLKSQLVTGDMSVTDQQQEACMEAWQI